MIRISLLKIKAGIRPRLILLLILGFSLLRYSSLQAQVFAMTDGNFLYACEGTILDPGGMGNYSPLMDVTQVVCSSNGQCLELVFSMVDMEANIDQLFVYSGIDTTGGLIATVTGSLYSDTVRSSVYENGCLTLNFKSNLFIQRSGFTAQISCAPCVINPDTINPEFVNLGESIDPIITCNSTIFQPSSTLLESQGNVITQTFCSGNDSCLKFMMLNSELDEYCESVRVYEGNSENGYLISTHTGFVSENFSYLFYRLSENSCITIEYERSNDLCHGSFEMILECIPCYDITNSTPYACERQLPMCELSVDVEFPLNAFNNRASENAIGCLSSSPNPNWYYIHPSTNNPIDLQLNATFDIDFICWGPFTESQYAQGVCTFVMNSEWANDPQNIIGCSYSGSSSENVVIPDVLPNSYYVILVTKLSYQADTMTVTFNENVAGLACTPFCSGVLNVEVSSCDSLTNTYSLQGTLALDSTEIEGIISLNSSFGFTSEFTAPFENLLNFNVGNLPANGALNALSINYNDVYSCGTNFTYYAPATCSECPVNIDEVGIVCDGDSLSLYATGNNLNQFHWIGPNGFELNQQHLHFGSFTSEMEGVYEVSASNSATGCSSISSVFVTIQPIPPVPLITTNSPLCAPDTLVMNASFIAGCQTRWRGPNNYFHQGNIAIIMDANELSSGLYSYTINDGQCSSRVDSIEVTIHPIPETPVIELNILNDSLAVSPAFNQYTWKINGEFNLDFDSQIIPLISTGYYQVFCLDEFGCLTASETVFFLGLSDRIKQPTMQLFPNPVREMLLYNSTSKGYWKLLDVSGRQIANGVLNSVTGSISTVDFSSGLYYFKFESKEGQTVIPVAIQH